ncbi:U-box domain-containing protein 8 [Amaranthus tricolor]|uniref:U-box domain-containing protein 8 n=1 Tax=Amaranthus tricolor TaxID=29722 RepID=UPI00258CF7AF|nr:U-box domain-containing protein 8 [Amaranthus tricolor]
MATPTELPEYFKCPISLEIMSDPVILSSGHTFDRSSIQRWIDSGHRTCPITKLPIPDPPSLIPNHALRSLIFNYAPSNNTHHHQPPTRLDSESDSLSQLGLSISTLTARTSSHSQKLEALSQLNSLSKSNADFRSRLTESGAVSALLRCVDSDNDPPLQEKLLSLLLNLSLDSDDNKVGLVAEGAVTKLVNALRGPAAAVAATVLTSLAVVEVNKATIGAHPGAVRSLVYLLRTGKGRERKEAATALFALCSFPENRRRTVDSGAVPILIRMAKSGTERAIEVLGLLAKCEEGREEMVKCDGVIVEILVNYVKNGSSRGIQYGLMTLNLLCCCSEMVKKMVRNEGVLEICLGLIQGDNEKILRVASNLAKVLQEN